MDSDDLEDSDSSKDSETEEKSDIKSKDDKTEENEHSDDEEKEITDENEKEEKTSKQNCEEEEEFEECMQKELDVKIQSLLNTLDNLQGSLKVICLNNKTYCLKIFEHLDALKKFKPNMESKLLQKAKSTALD